MRVLTRLAVVTIALVSCGCADLEGDGADFIPGPTSPPIQSTTIDPTATTPSSSTTTTPGPTTSAAVTTIPPSTARVSLPDVYDLAAEEALARLAELDVVVISYPVCSSSVGEGQVRQIILPDETILVDKDGVTEAGRAVDAGSVIEVKVGTGRGC